ENGAMATLSKQLATIDRNVPLTVTLPDLVKKEPSPEELLSLLQELEFRSMQAKLFGKKAPEARKSPLPADDLFAPPRRRNSFRWRRSPRPFREHGRAVPAKWTCLRNAI
ncbi:hypothetical protein, partial [uncultured Akkermansia sp.]|uniref:hypothetical protein n=1 Tax=uncultured Akkermansia sp. TaxID=512294 RepID=UPI0026129E28